MAKNRSSKPRYANSATRSGKEYSRSISNKESELVLGATTQQNQFEIQTLVSEAQYLPSLPISGLKNPVDKPLSNILADSDATTDRWTETVAPHDLANTGATKELGKNSETIGNVNEVIGDGTENLGGLSELIEEGNVASNADGLDVDTGLNNECTADAIVQNLSDVNSVVVPPILSTNSIPSTFEISMQDARENVTNKLLIPPTLPAYVVNTDVSPSQANPIPPFQSEPCTQHDIIYDMPSKKPPSQQSNVINKALYSSFFTTLPRCAGEYSPRKFTTLPDNPTPPIEIVQEGVNVWKEYLVGFFLDSDISYHDVREQVRSAWKLRGGLRVNFMNGMYYFKFSLLDDRSRVLESDPAILGGKPFIVTSWSTTVERARERVVSIPVWAIFTRIPTVLQTLPGLNWLGSRIGNFKCFDANTETRKNLVFAKAMIEITPTKPLPNKLKVSIEGYDTFVDVQYTWQPEICSNCQTFGHLFDACKRTANCPIQDKIPLLKPTPRIWAPKTKLVPDLVPEVNSIVTPVSLSELASKDVNGAVLDVSVSNTDKANVTTYETDRLDVAAQSKVREVSTALDTSDHSDSSSEEDDGIYWQSDDTSWLHINSGMRYDPMENMYYIYVSDLEDENRRLFYKVVGEDFVLIEVGEIGAWNSSLFHDSTWDWVREFRSPNPCYVPNLAVPFMEYVNVIGTSSSSCYSSVEE